MGNMAMAKIVPTKMRKNDCPTYKRVVPTVISNTLRLYAAGRPSQTSSFLSHQMALPEKLRMLSLMPSTLPLVSARTKRDLPYT